MKKIIVTGGNGQLGNELRLLAGDHPFEFVFTDVQQLDITNESDVISFFGKLKPSFCINCAAYTAVDKAESDQETAFQINATGPANLASACKQYNTGFIQISTDFVFDGEHYRPYTEDIAPNPISVYGESKWEGEKRALEANPDSVIIRTAWLYSSFGSNFVKTMLRLAQEREKLGVVFDQIGTPTYAADLANAILTCIKNWGSVPPEIRRGIYHYSNDGVASWYDFSKAIFEMTEKRIHVSPIKAFQYPTPAKRPHFSVLDKSKIKEVFGVEVPYWRDSLKICIAKL